MVPFAAKFGLVEGEVNERDYDWLAELYALYFGHDPKGNWILVVRADNTSEIFRFDDPKDMWCCQPERERHLNRREETQFTEPFAGTRGSRPG